MGIVIPAALVLAVIGAAFVTYMARMADHAETGEGIEPEIRHQLNQRRK